MSLPCCEFINLDFKAHVDEPANGTVDNFEPLIRGWVFAVNHAKVARICARESDFLFPASIGVPRPDVAAAYPAWPEALHSEFWIKLPFCPGYREITLHAMLTDSEAWHSFAVVRFSGESAGLCGPAGGGVPRFDIPAICHVPADHKHRKRIVIDGRILHRTIGGTERYISAIIDHLRLIPEATGYELHVLVWGLPASLFPGVVYCTRHHLEEVRMADVFFKTFPAGEDVYLEEMAAARRCVFMPQDLILYSHPDYMLSMEQHLTYARFLRAAVHLADTTLAISEAGRRDLIERMGVPPEKVVRIYDGVQPPPHASHAERQRTDEEMTAKIGDQPYFLCVAANYPHKNLDLLVEAYESARAELPGVALVIVGSSPYLHARPAQACEGLMRLGHVSDGALRWLYEHARALVSPSLYEGFGFPPLEAMSVGVPVVASDASCFPEICGDAALFFKARSASDLAGAMVRIHTDEPLRQELIRKGFPRSASFSWERTARATAEILLAEKPTEAPEVARKEGILRRHYAKLTYDRLLLFVTHVRFFPVGAGNELGIWNLVRHLKTSGYQIAVILTDLDRVRLADHHRYEILKTVDLLYEIQPGDEWFCPSSLPADVSARLPCEPILSKWAAMEHGFCPDITVAATHLALRILRPQVLVAQYIWFSRILPLAPPDTLKVIHLHDKFSNKGRQVEAFGIDDALSLTEEEERAFLDRADLGLSAQPDETRQFSLLGSKCRVLTIGVAIDLPPAKAAPGEQPHQVLIVASGNPMNRHSVQWFIDRIWPSVMTRHPTAKLTVAGRVCALLSLGDNAKDVELLGYVEDIAALYSTAAIVVNPVAAGTGLKVKTIEALAFGKAIVAAPEGVAGLPSRTEPYFLVAKDEAEWVDRLSHLLSDDDARRRLTVNAVDARESLSATATYREFLQELANAGVTTPSFGG
jgi:glycosyltransferase involved in cell wall biosynthesis